MRRAISVIILTAAVVLLAYELGKTSELLTKISLQLDTAGARTERFERSITEHLKRLEHPTGKPPEQQR